MSLSIAIEVNQLSKKYKGSVIPAVNNINFNVPQGEIFGLLGPNGAGKTTTISILCGLMSPTDGSATLNGLSYSKNREEIKKIIGVVPQEIALYPTLSTFENLRYYGNMFGLKGALLKEKIMQHLEQFNLIDFANKPISTFSGGMKRRVNLIAAILHQPKILFLDEPTVGVDVQSRNVILEFLLKLNKAGTTIIYTSHLMEEAQNFCTGIAIIDQGMIIAKGTPKNLISEYACVNLEELFLKLTGRNLRD
jgi:ABC-2 type transport system ATP-binding protein